MRSWATQISSTQQALLAKSPKGRLRNPVSLAQRMRSSTRAWPRWRGFEVGDVGVGRVGDEDLVTPASRVKEVELGPVVGLFSSDDGSGANWPQRQVEVRQLGHLGPLADLTVCGDGLGPRLLRKGQNGQADGLLHLETDGELDAPLDQGVDEFVTGPGLSVRTNMATPLSGSRPLGLTGNWSRARSSTSMWSSALWGALLPARSKMAKASLVASRKQANGEKP